MAIRAIATDSQDFNNPSTTGKPGRDERLDFKNEAGDTVFSIVSDADGTASIQGDAVPKVYRALLTQAGPSAPVPTVLENTLGGTVVWTRSDAGQYVGTLAGAFSTTKPVNWLRFISDAEVAEAKKFIRLETTSANTVSLTTGDPDNGLADDLRAEPEYVDIIVYP